MPPTTRSSLGSAEPQLTLEHVSKFFGPRPEAALRRFQRTGATGPGEGLGIYDVSLEIPKGRTFVLMGLSGSGKSTLLRLLNRLYRPTAGRVLVGGADIGRLKRRELIRFRRRTLSGMVFQSFALLPFRTVLGNVAFGLELQGVEKKERLERAHAALELVGLGGHGHVLPAELSGGMQQRLGLARALVLGGDVLLMDEPFSALDPITKRELQDELLRLQASVHKTIVLVTHDMTEALKLGDRIALLKAGQVQQVGAPEEIVARPANAYVASFVAGVNRTAFLTASSVMTPSPQAERAPDHTPDLCIKPGTPLAEIVRLAATDTRTLSVVGERGQLLGTITPQGVLAALAERAPVALEPGL